MAGGMDFNSLSCATLWSGDGDVRPPQPGRAVRAPVGVRSNQAEAFRTYCWLRLSSRRRDPGAECIHWLDDEEKDDQSNDQKGDERVDECAIADFAVIDRERQRREVRLPANCRNERRDDVL